VGVGRVGVGSTDVDGRQEERRRDSMSNEEHKMMPCPLPGPPPFVLFKWGREGFLPQHIPLMEDEEVRKTLLVFSRWLRIR